MSAIVFPVGAYDFSQLLANEEVYLTRAERVAGTPMVKHTPAVR